jgi:hypothetical protein
VPSAGDALLIQNAAPGSINIRTNIININLGIRLTVLPSLWFVALPACPKKARPCLLSNLKTTRKIKILVVG